VSTAVTAIVVVWVAVLVIGSLWIWQRSRRVGLDEKRAQERRRAERDRHRPERDLERAVRQATSAGAVVAVDRRGHDPTRVRWSDGSVWFFYDGEESYAAAEQRGTLPAGIAHVGEPPPLGAPRPTR
jgi:hypothetical protein